MNKAPELKPCPFCGCANISRSTGRTGDDKPWHYIECDNCGATTEPEIWNIRALLAAVEGSALTPRDERAVTDDEQQRETAPEGAVDGDCLTTPVLPTANGAEGQNSNEHAARFERGDHSRVTTQSEGRVVDAAAMEIWHARSDHFGEVRKAFVMDERWDLCVAYARAAMPVIIGECAATALRESMKAPQSVDHPWDRGYRAGAAACWANIRAIKTSSKDRGVSAHPSLSGREGEKSPLARAIEDARGGPAPPSPKRGFA